MEISYDALRLLIALLLGGAIGLEREVSDKAAGLRTNTLICLGACLFSIISEKFTHDPARVAAQIVAGIGFIGAGAIMREGIQVTGLTTAATIWTVAAVGVAVGFGHFRLAAAGAVVILFVQAAFTPLDILIDDIRERHTFRVLSRLDDKSIEEIETHFRAAKLRVIRRKLMKRSGQYYSEWYTSGPRANHEKVAQALLLSKEVVELTY